MYADLNDIFSPAELGYRAGKLGYHSIRVPCHALFSAVLLRESLTYKTVIGIVISAVGVVLIVL